MYAPRDDDSWIFDKFAKDEDISIKQTFFLSSRHLVEADGEDPNDEFASSGPVRFRVATAEGEYFRFDPDALALKCPVLLARDAEPTWKWFTAERNTSILKVIAELNPTRIVIGGSDPEAIPVQEYMALVEKFPTAHELRRYVLLISKSIPDAGRHFSAAIEKYYPSG